MDFLGNPPSGIDFVRVLCTEVTANVRLCLYDPYRSQCIHCQIVRVFTFSVFIFV